MNSDKKIMYGVVAGFVLGLLWLVGLRFVTYQPDDTHYHANFALYVNGKRDEFKNFTFYEEVQSCGTNEANNPKHRVHMHDHINRVAHVHEEGVMWSHFFTNLGYLLGDDLIKTDQGMFVDGQEGNKLTFVLNGKPTNTIANKHIESEDTLLISYGQEDGEILRQRYDAIIKDAADYNQRPDPASCSGTKELTPLERLKKAIGIGN